MFLQQLILPGESEEIHLDYPADIQTGSGFNFTNLASLVNKALNYFFPAAGLILLFILISAGFQYLTAAGNEESIKKASQKITYAAIGFAIIFLSFWLMKIIEAVFGVAILQFGNSSSQPAPTLPGGR